MKNEPFEIAIFCLLLFILVMFPLFIFRYKIIEIFDHVKRKTLNCIIEHLYN